MRESSPRPSNRQQWQQLFLLTKFPSTSKKTTSLGLVFRTGIICCLLGDFVIGSAFATRCTPMSIASVQVSRAEAKEVA